MDAAVRNNKIMVQKWRKKKVKYAEPIGLTSKHVHSDAKSRYTELLPHYQKISLCIVIEPNPF